MRLLSIDVGIRNCAICVLEDSRILCWKILNLTYGNDLCTTLIQALDALSEMVQGATVVIERQMTRKMTNVQCYLEMYYRLKGHSVILYSPKHKLAGSGKENSGKGLYAARKKASVELCETWLKDHPQEEWVEAVWKERRKKDDLSDALHMAIAYQANPQADVITIVKKIVARKPTPLQEKRGRYSKSNIKYLLAEQPTTFSKKLMNSILRFWSDIDSCKKELGL